MSLSEADGLSTGVYFFVLFATSITVSINIPEFSVFVLVLAFVTGVMLALYLPASTQIKAMKSDTAGGLVSLTCEVLEGLPLIQVCCPYTKSCGLKCFL